MDVDRAKVAVILNLTASSHHSTHSIFPTATQQILRRLLKTSTSHVCVKQQSWRKSQKKWRIYCKYNCRWHVANLGVGWQPDRTPAATSILQHTCNLLKLRNAAHSIPQARTDDDDALYGKDGGGLLKPMVSADDAPLKSPLAQGHLQPEGHGDESKKQISAPAGLTSMTGQYVTDTAPNVSEE